ncbi:unnamed protein product [Adineta ricciae]|uniref:Uncharacterized protein n=1 Tax=Adineta ricciae TaxID=249248 RepID=A0A814NIW8_ADIRI|nr:unnamed protein product [Adineta ricciae]CAF1425953.1 unnamed protein product [Adineta ricciae]
MFFPIYFYLTILIYEHRLSAVPTCIIIDTDIIQQPEENTSSINNRSSSAILLRNLRMLDHQRSPDFVAEPIPLSYIDVKQLSTSVSSTPPLIDLDESVLKKALVEPVVERSYASCSFQSLNEIETYMVVPFEFRRLRIEQPDHYTKFLDDDPREAVPDLSTAVYERRSDPDGVHFCRTCHDGSWGELAVCETVRCDAELLRANPRLVTEWGEIKPLDGGALYAPSTIFAIYAFAFGPHCKRCEPNGQWSRYALPEICSEIKFFGRGTSTTTTTTTTTLKVNRNIYPRIKQGTTSSAVKSSNKKQ